MASVILSDALVRTRFCSPSSSSATATSTATSSLLSASSSPSPSSSFPRKPVKFGELARAAISVPRESFERVPVTIASRIPSVVVRSSSLMANSAAAMNGVYTVGEFMTKRKNLHVVKPTTTVDEALEILVENRITGFPVVDDDWKLVGVVSDYDLLALDSISGGSGKCETNLFPEVNSTWKTFREVQKLLCKTNGKVIGELMTPAPLVVRETTNLEDAARLLLETKYRRLPVVDSAGKLVGIITRGNVVRAALQIKRASGNVN